jgi:hypothetical protein
MSHTIKLWERVIGHRLRHETQISNNQFGFMRGKKIKRLIKIFL